MAIRALSRERWVQAGLILLLAIAVLAAFWPSLLAGFIWDDDDYVVRNLLLHSLGGLRHIWFNVTAAPHEPQYYPLTHATFWIEYHLWRLWPLGYHLDNLLLHLASAIALWRLLDHLKMPGAYLAAMLWAVHPLQAESVAWVTERKNVLSGVLYLLSLRCYLATPWGKSFSRPLSPSPGTAGGDRGEGGPRNHSHPTPGSSRRVIASIFPFHALSLVLFIGALLSKSVTATLPAAILLLAWWKRGRVAWRDLPPLLPFLAAGLAMGSLTGWLEKHQVGATGPDFDWLTPIDRIAIAGRALWFYLSKLLLPLRLTFIYPRWSIDPTAHPWQLLFALTVLSTLWASWRLRGRIGRGPLAAALFFCGTLVPALGFANVFPMRYSYVADHFQYLAGIGPIVLATALLSHRRLRRVGQGALALLVIGCCLASNRQTRIYQSLQTLWTDTLAKNPSAWMAHQNRAVVLIESGEFDLAEDELYEVLRLRPNDINARLNLGIIHQLRGDFDGAIQYLGEALRQIPDSTEATWREKRSDIYIQYGVAYSKRAAMQIRTKSADQPMINANLQLAIDAFTEAIINQDRPDTRVNLGQLLAWQGKLNEAIEQFRQALASDPDSTVAANNLANALARQAEAQRASNAQPPTQNAVSSPAIIEK